MASETELFYLVLVFFLICIMHLILAFKGPRRKGKER